MKRPSDFMIYPWSSVTGNSESETIALNIIAILKRTGNNWRKLDWEEYQLEREKDGNFSSREKEYFDRVLAYTVSEDTAVLFSPKWAKVEKKDTYPSAPPQPFS